MARGRYVYCKVQQKVVLKGTEINPVKPRKAVRGVIADTMDAIMHPCTGEMIDSKSRFRAITKAHGCVEYGDQMPTSSTPNWDIPTTVEEDVVEMYERMEAGTLPKYDEPETHVEGLDNDFTNIPVIND